MLDLIDKEIHKCNMCGDLVEKFPNSKTVSIGKNKDIVILGEAPANNGWRKSGIAWYDINHKLLPSGVVMQKLLDKLDIKLEDTYFLEAIKCYPKDRKYLSKCSSNCKKFLIKQLQTINPKVVLSLLPLFKGLFFKLSLVFIPHLVQNLSSLFNLLPHLVQYKNTNSIPNKYYK